MSPAAHLPFAAQAAAPSRAARGAFLPNAARGAAGNGPLRRPLCGVHAFVPAASNGYCTKRTCGFVMMASKMAVKRCSYSAGLPLPRGLWPS